MGTCFLHGNGGAGFNLNLSFKNYASSSALLDDTPKENTIGIVSTVAVSRWRFTSVSEPGATSPAGYVYINASLDGDNRNSTTIPTFDPINKNGNMILLKPTRCIQLVNGSWKTMTAYIYKKGTWIRFSKEFAATIKVTYPSGSTCTATNGNTKLTAPNTSGTWTCVVPNTGNWTIKSVKGSQSASKTVSITTDGQSASVTLTYKYYIVNAGGTANYTGGWTKAGNASGGVNSNGSVYLRTDHNSSGSITMTTGISNFANYSKLQIVQSTNVNAHYFRIVNSNGDSITEKSTNTTTSPITIDLTALNLSGSSLYRFRIQGGTVGGTSGATTTVTQIWLE